VKEKNDMQGDKEKQEEEKINDKESRRKMKSRGIRKIEREG